MGIRGLPNILEALALILLAAKKEGTMIAWRAEHLLLARVEQGRRIVSSRTTRAT